MKDMWLPKIRPGVSVVQPSQDRLRDDVPTRSVETTGETSPHRDLRLLKNDQAEWNFRKGQRILGGASTRPVITEDDE